MEGSPYLLGQNFNPRFTPIFMNFDRYKFFNRYQLIIKQKKPEKNVHRSKMIIFI